MCLSVCLSVCLAEKALHFSIGIRSSAGQDRLDLGSSWAHRDPLTGILSQPFLSYCPSSHPRDHTHHTHHTHHAGHKIFFLSSPPHSSLPSCNLQPATLPPPPNPTNCSSTEPDTTASTRFYCHGQEEDLRRKG